MNFKEITFYNDLSGSLNMKKKIREKTVHSSCFREQIAAFLEERGLGVQDVIGISSKGDFTTLWYWDQ